MTRNLPLKSCGTVLSLTVGLLVVSALPAQADTSSFPAAANVTKINELMLTPGALFYEDDRATTSPTAPVRSLFRRSASQAAGVVSVGPEVQIAPSVGNFLTASGERYAYSNAANTALTVVGPGASTRSVALSSATTTDVKLSGSLLLISTTTGDTLADLVTGVRRALPAGTNLFGRYAIWFNTDGSVDRRDLTTGTTRRMRVAGNASPCSLTVPCTTTAAKTSAKVWGDWVLWRFDCETKALKVTTPASTPITLPCSKGTSLGNGFAVSRDTAVPANLLQKDLVGAMPTTTLATNVKKISLEDRLVAYSDASTNDISVQSITPPAVAGSARLLTSNASPAFSPNGDGSGDSWNAELAFSKPLASWDVTVKDSAGTVVRQLASSAPASVGTIRTAWDGKDANGALAVDGVYTWRATAVAQDGDGAAVGDDGAAGGMSGTVVVRRTSPGAKVSAQALSTTTSATRYLPVTWGTTTVPLAGYKVTAYDTRVAVNRSATSSAWLTKTTAVSGQYPGTPGNTYRFQVRARDNAGNVGPWTAPVASILPFDDRSTSVKYLGTWTAVTTSGAYLSTERLGSAKGAKASLSAPMAAVRIVARTCAVCGGFTVLVDGKAVASVDTYSATTRVRRLVYSRTISSTPGTHTVTVIVAGTAGRPRVYLDGLGTLR